jgi:hypothetical protein
MKTTVLWDVVPCSLVQIGRYVIDAVLSGR